MLSLDGVTGAAALESWEGPGTDSLRAGSGGAVTLTGGLTAVGGGNF